MFRTVAGYCEWVGVVALLLAMLATVVDVLGAKLFALPLRGALEVVSYGQAIALSAGLAMALYAKRHIRVDFLVENLPPTLQRLLKTGVALISLLLLGLLCVYTLQNALSLYRAGQVFSTIALPVYPFVLAFALFLLVAALYFLDELWDVWRGKA